MVKLEVSQTSQWISKTLLILLVVGMWGCGRPAAVRDTTPRAPVTELSNRSSTPAVQRNPVAESGQKSAAAHLMRSARRSVQAGNLSSAAEMLERAKRIDPYSAVIWSNLADVRLRQKQYKLAESLAFKSNSYTGSDRKLKRINWEIIEKARNLRGDKEGAARARDKINSLR